MSGIFELLPKCTDTSSLLLEVLQGCDRYTAISLLDSIFGPKGTFGDTPNLNVTQRLLQLFKTSKEVSIPSGVKVGAVSSIPKPDRNNLVFEIKLFKKVMDMVAKKAETKQTSPKVTPTNITNIIVSVIDKQTNPLKTVQNNYLKTLKNIESNFSRYTASNYRNVIYIQEPNRVNFQFNSDTNQELNFKFKKGLGLKLDEITVTISQTESENNFSAQIERMAERIANRCFKYSKEKENVEQPAPIERDKTRVKIFNGNSVETNEDFYELFGTSTYEHGIFNLEELFTEYVEKEDENVKIMRDALKRVKDVTYRYNPLRLLSYVPQFSIIVPIVANSLPYMVSYGTIANYSSPVIDILKAFCAGLLLYNRYKTVITSGHFSKKNEFITFFKVLLFILAIPVILYSVNSFQRSREDSLFGSDSVHSDLFKSDSVHSQLDVPLPSASTTTKELRPTLFTLLPALKNQNDPIVNGMLTLYTFETLAYSYLYDPGNVATNTMVSVLVSFSLKQIRFVEEVNHVVNTNRETCRYLSAYNTLYKFLRNKDATAIPNDNLGFTENEMRILQGLTAQTEEDKDKLRALDLLLNVPKTNDNFKKGIFDDYVTNIFKFYRQKNLKIQPVNNSVHVGSKEVLLFENAPNPDSTILGVCDIADFRKFLKSAVDKIPANTLVAAVSTGAALSGAGAFALTASPTISATISAYVASFILEFYYGLQIYEVKRTLLSESESANWGYSLFTDQFLLKQIIFPDSYSNSGEVPSMILKSDEFAKINGFIEEQARKDRSISFEETIKLSDVYESAATSTTPVFLRKVSQIQNGVQPTGRNVDRMTLLATIVWKKAIALGNKTVSDAMEFLISKLQEDEFVISKFGNKMVNNRVHRVSQYGETFTNIFLHFPSENDPEQTLEYTRSFLFPGSFSLIGTEVFLGTKYSTFDFKDRLKTKIILQSRNKFDYQLERNHFSTFERASFFLHSTLLDFAFQHNVKELSLPKVLVMYFLDRTKSDDQIITYRLEKRSLYNLLRDKGFLRWNKADTVKLKKTFKTEKITNLLNIVYPELYVVNLDVVNSNEETETLTETLTEDTRNQLVDALLMKRLSNSTDTLQNYEPSPILKKLKEDNFTYIENVTITFNTTKASGTTGTASAQAAMKVANAFDGLRDIVKRYA